MKRLLLLLASAFCLSSLFAAAGSSESSAISIKIGEEKAVQLVEDTGPWSTGFGVCYLKMTLRKGKAYTVWFEGGDADAIGVDGLEVYAYEDWGGDWDDWDDDFDDFNPNFDDWGDDDWGGGGSVNSMPWASFGLAEVQYGNYVTWMQADSWDADDPTSWTYYICLSGDIGLKTRVHVVEGIQSFLPVGLEGNPRKITFTSAEQSFSGATTEESAYFFTSPLEAGHKYVVRTTGGTDASPLTLATYAPVNYRREEVTVGPNDQAFAVFPEESATFQFAVYANASNAPFGFAWQDELGTLVVELRGAPDATWTIDKDKTPHESGDSLVLAGEHTITFSKVKGFSTPVSQTVSVKPGKGERTIVVGTYNDTFDPKDDEAKGATSLKVSAKETVAPRTLWGLDASGVIADPADWFSFAAKAGSSYNFQLRDRSGDAVLSVLDAIGQPVDPSASGVTAVSRLALDSGTYYVKVAHAETLAADGSYSLVASCANVGAIAFDKSAVSVKKDAGVVKLGVKRTAKEGRVRVRYSTVAGTAEPGVRFIAQEGVLEWANGDNKKKEIAVKIIPDLVPVYDASATSWQFQVKLEPLAAEELEDDEYAASVSVDTCTVTINESAKPGATVASAYAKSAAKRATVTTEDVSLRSGTFGGVLVADGESVAGQDRLASFALTVSTADKVSATVQVASRKKLTFSSKEADWQTLEDGRVQVTLASGDAMLALTLFDGESTVDGAWLNAGGEATLTLGGATYAGEVFRQNAKIQGYLDAALKFAGYYTVALVPENVTAGDGVPAGNGYVTVKVDNKGTATVAGLLADGTKVSQKVVAAAIRADEASPLGYAMVLPFCTVKAPSCFGGTIRLMAQEGTTLPDKAYVIVADSQTKLVWNNDNEKLTYDGEEGWQIACQPVGGWYDTVFNLQAYYQSAAFEVATADLLDFPSELLPEDYDYSFDAEPNGQALDLTGNAFSVAKKVLVKAGKWTDLSASVNPCDVKIKFTRATGVYSGSFSLWADDGLSQKELKGWKLNGVLLLTRDSASPLFDEQAGAGSCSQSVKLDDGRKWTCSLPFNLLFNEW